MFDGDRTEPDDLLDLRLANPNEPVSVYRAGLDDRRRPARGADDRPTRAVRLTQRRPRCRSCDHEPGSRPGDPHLGNPPFVKFQKKCDPDTAGRAAGASRRARLPLHRARPVWLQGEATPHDHDRDRPIADPRRGGPDVPGGSQDRHPVGGWHPSAPPVDTADSTKPRSPPCSPKRPVTRHVNRLIHVPRNAVTQPRPGDPVRQDRDNREVGHGDEDERLAASTNTPWVVKSETTNRCHRDDPAAPLAHLSGGPPGRWSCRAVAGT